MTCHYCGWIVLWNCVYVITLCICIELRFGVMESTSGDDGNNTAVKNDRTAGIDNTTLPDQTQVWG